MDTAGTSHYAAWLPRPGALQPGWAREALLGPGPEAELELLSAFCWAGGTGRPAVPLGKFSAAGRPGLRHHLCSASSRGSVEPPWAQAPRGLLPWAWGSHHLGSPHGGREGGWWGQSAGTRTSRGEAALLGSGWLCLSCWPDAWPPTRSAGGGRRRVTDLLLPLAQQCAREPPGPQCYLSGGPACLPRVLQATD